MERPFRTVKEMHETLYHFHEPESEEEANAWLLHFLHRYNAMAHRSGERTRLEDWLEHLPASGVRAMCGWERFRAFAREPERRKASERRPRHRRRGRLRGRPGAGRGNGRAVVGPVRPRAFRRARRRALRAVPARPRPVALHRWRPFRKTRLERQADRVEELAAKLSIVRSALSGRPELAALAGPASIAAERFRDPDPFGELRFPNALAAKRAIADALGMPLARLTGPQMERVEAIVGGTLEKKQVLARVREALRTPEEERRHVE